MWGTGRRWPWQVNGTYWRGVSAAMAEVDEKANGQGGKSKNWEDPMWQKRVGLLCERRFTGNGFLALSGGGKVWTGQQENKGK